MAFDAYKKIKDLESGLSDDERSQRAAEAAKRLESLNLSPAKVDVGDTVDGLATALNAELFSDVATDRKKRIRPSAEEFNVSAREYLTKHGNDHKVTVTELKKAIGCSRGVVPKLGAWRAYQDEWTKRNPPKSGRNVVSLPPDEVLPDEKDELQRLIAEHEADDRIEKGPNRLHRRV